MCDRFFRQRAYIGITHSCMRWYVRKIESIIGVQWGQKNPNRRVHRSSGKRGLPSFPLNGGPQGWDFFLEPLNTNDRFFFSYTTTLRYSTVISFGDVTELDDARCTNQLERANKQRINNEQMVISSKWIYKN